MIRMQDYKIVMKIYIKMLKNNNKINKVNNLYLIMKNSLKKKNLTEV